MVLGIYTISYTKVDTTGNITTATRTIIVSAPVQVVSITGGGGGVSYTPATNSTPTATDTGTLNAAPEIIPTVTLGTPPSSSLIKRKILRALLQTRAFHRKKSDNPVSIISTVDMASAPILDTGILEVSKVRVNIRLAPATDAKIIGELKRGDQVQPLRMRDGWIEFQFGDIIGWTKRGFLSDL